MLCSFAVNNTIMAKAIKKLSKKKEIKTAVALKIEKALLKYKPAIGDKKFAKLLKQATKLFSTEILGIEKKNVKESKPKPKKATSFLID